MTPEQAAAKAAEALNRAAENASIPDLAKAYTEIADGWTRLHHVLASVPTHEQRLAKAHARLGMVASQARAWAAIYEAQDAGRRWWWRLLPWRPRPNLEEVYRRLRESDESR